MSGGSIRPTPEIAGIVAVVGDAAALALVAAFGGIRIEVPVTAKRGSVLVRAIGLPATRLMVAEFGGARLRVPLAKNWRMLHLRAAGKSYSEIARAVGADESRVFRVLADHGQTRQMALDLWPRLPLPPLPGQG